MNKYDALEIQTYQKDRNMITAKYKATLLEQHIMNLAISKVELAAENGEIVLEAKLYPSQIKRLISDQSHIYRDLSGLAKKLTGRSMYIEDGKGNFKAFAMITNCEYIDKVFTIKFNNELRNHMIGLENRFTKYELSITTTFKRKASLRLYEVLKKDIYRIDSQNESVVVEYRLSELRFIIGVADMECKAAKNAIALMGKNIDWDAVYETLEKKDKTYDNWKDFQRRILIPAKEELEEKSDIRFEYEGCREGRKIATVKFRVYKNTPANIEIIEDKHHTIDSLKSMPTNISDLYEKYKNHNGLTQDILDKLLIEADGDTELVKKCIKLADKQEVIDNYVGWIIGAIRHPDHYDNNIKVVEGSTENAITYDKIREEIEEEDKKIKSLWEKIKVKDDYADFSEEVLLETGQPIEILEEIYEVKDLFDCYISWKREKIVTLR